MTADKIVSELVASQVAEKSTITCEADSSGSLAGESFQFTVTDGVSDYTHQPYFIIKAQSAVNKITTIADVESALAGVSFVFSVKDADGEVKYQPWFAVDETGTEPTPAGTEILVPVAISAGDTAVAVAQALYDALDGIGSDLFTLTLDEDDVYITNVAQMAVTDAVDVDSGFSFAVSKEGTTVDGDAPAEPVGTLIPVYIDINSTAIAVASALESAIENNVSYLRVAVSTDDDDLIIENVRAGAVSASADVDTGWASFVRSATGSNTKVTNMGANVATAEYKYFPGEGKVTYARSLNIVLADDDCTDNAKFGNLTALSNGLNIQLMSVDKTAFKTIFGTIKTNGDLASIGRASVQAGTVDRLQVEVDLVDLFGAEVAVDGSIGQYLEVDVNDNLNGIASFVCRVNGHIKDSFAV